MPELDLDAIEELHSKTTRGEWFYNSYTQICASMPRGHKLDTAPADEPPGGAVLWVQGPEDFSGDDVGLVCKEAAANGLFAAEAHQWVPALIARVRELEKDVESYELNAEEFETALIKKNERVRGLEQDGTILEAHCQYLQDRLDHIVEANKAVALRNK